MAKFKFKPGKDVGADGVVSEIDNGTKADYGEAGLSGAFGGSGRDIQDSATITDLIANLGHYCDRTGIDFNDILASARMHWEMER